MGSLDPGPSPPPAVWGKGGSGPREAVSCSSRPVTQSGWGPSSLPMSLVPDLGFGGGQASTPFGLCWKLAPPASHVSGAGWDPCSWQPWPGVPPSVGEPGPPACQKFTWAALASVAQHVPSLLRLLREQWIRAKYERQEFAHPERQEPYSAGEAARSWASAPAPQSWSRAPRNLGGRFSVWACVRPPALNTGWLTWPQGPYSCSQLRPEPA